MIRARLGRRWQRLAELQDEAPDYGVMSRLRMRANRWRRHRILRDGTVIGKWRHGLPKHGVDE